MTSVPHEAARQMVRDCPDLVLELLRRGQGVVLPEPESIVLEEADLSQVLPAELRSDVVVEMLEHGGGRTGLIVEVQLARDQDKLYSWPSYAAALHARMRAQVCLVVLTFDRDVALWAARPILTLQLGSRFQPLVLGPEQIPLVVDPRQAADMPQLAMLSALCHGEGDEAALVVAVSERAVDGAATAAVLAAVAQAFEVRTRAVTLVTGATSRTKVLDVDIDDAEGHRRWVALLDS